FHSARRELVLDLSGPGGGLLARNPLLGGGVLCDRERSAGCRQGDEESDDDRLTSRHGLFPLHAFRPSEAVLEFRGRSIDVENRGTETYHTSLEGASAAARVFDFSASLRLPSQT